MKSFARSLVRIAPAAVVALLVGCAVESSDPSSSPSPGAPGLAPSPGASPASPASAPAAAPVGPMRERMTPPKPSAAVQSPYLHDDEVIVKFKEGTHVRLRAGVLDFAPAALGGNEPMLLARHGLAHTAITADVKAANVLLGSLAIERHFDRPEPDLDAWKASGEARAGEEVADLNLYFHVKVDGPLAQKALLEKLNALASVELAYAPPRPENAAADLPPSTGSFTADQTYVNAAPIGIDARYARTVEGGAGAGVKVIDVEGGWNLAHEDMPALFTSSGSVGLDQHGTAVLGEIAAAENAYGMTGIASDVKIGVASVINAPAGSTTTSYSVARAVSTASASLAAGDVILIEQHAHGPASGLTCTCNCGQFEYVAMEYWQAEYDAIHAATANGVNVVEAAGNGSMNLDSAIYASRFNRATRDSGAIVVGAGTSAGGRAPECWTNYGNRVDVQGWGDSVASLGYGDIQANGADANQWYATTFSGTSSASPIVVGAVADVQGARIAHGLGVASPAAMRSLLTSTGTAQAASTKHIGPLPNLHAALDGLAIAPKVEFLHTATTTNSSFDYTLIDNPATNGKPNVVLQATHNWGGTVGGVYDDHALGVFYNTGAARWGVFHEDLSAVPAGAMFNVVVNEGYVHYATTANTSGYITTLDHPLANGNPNAVLLVTPSWNPGGAAGVYDNHPVAVWYNGSRWTIYNEDLVAIPANASFNVAVSPYGSFRHVAATPSGWTSLINNPLSNGRPGAHLVISHWFGPSSIYDTKNVAVYYSTTGWALYDESKAAMTANTAFDVFVASAVRPTW